MFALWRRVDNVASVPSGLHLLGLANESDDQRLSFPAICHSRTIAPFRARSDFDANFDQK
jgi:hypothetical protein